jgi:tetratricopeptide (TPR) repeat protein
MQKRGSGIGGRGSGLRPNGPDRVWLPALFCVVITAAFCPSFVHAQQSDPLVADVSDELARARKACDDGDRAGVKARRIAIEKPQDSIALLDQQVEFYKQAQTAFRQALEKDAKNPRALTEYARFWIARGQYVPARAHLETALKSLDDKTLKHMSGFSEDEKAEFQADVLRTLGGVLERAAETDLAVGYYYKALGLVPVDSKTRISLAVALCASGRAPESIGLLKGWNEDGQGTGVPKAPAQRALGVYTLAVAQEETGFYEDALHSYTLARKLAQEAGPTETAGVLDNASLSIERLQDFFDDLKDKAADREKENAARVVQKLAPLPDQRAEIARALYDFDQGVSFKDRALKDQSFVIALARSRAIWGSSATDDSLSNHPTWDTFQAAMQWFTDALQIYPRLHQAAYQLALCNVMSGHYAPARTCLEAATVASPYNLATLNEQGAVLIELGQWEEAAATFKKILTLESDSGSANFGLATALAALQRDEGECRTALDAFDRAAQLGYRDPHMFHTQVLVKKDGTEYHGKVRTDGDTYIIYLTDATEKVAKADCQELIEKPSLREELVDMVARFQRGERPAPPPKMRRRQAKKHSTIDPFQGTIFDRK